MYRFYSNESGLLVPRTSLGDPVIKDLQMANYRQAMLNEFGSAGAVVLGARGTALQGLAGTDSKTDLVVKSCAEYADLLLQGKDVETSTKAALTDALTGVVMGQLAIAGGIGCGIVAAAVAPLGALCAIGVSALLEVLSGPIGELIGAAVGVVINAVKSIGEGFINAFDKLGQGDVGGFFVSIGQGFENAWNGLLKAINPDSDGYHRDSHHVAYMAMAQLHKTLDLIAAKERLAIVTLMEMHNKLLVQAKKQYNIQGAPWDFERARAFFEARYVAGTNTYPAKWNGMKRSDMASYTVPLGGLRQILPVRCRPNTDVYAMWVRPYDALPQNPARPFLGPKVSRDYGKYFGRAEETGCHVVWPWPGPGQDYKLNEMGAINNIPPFWVPGGRPPDGVDYMLRTSFTFWTFGGFDGRKDGGGNPMATSATFLGTFMWQMQDLAQRQSDIIAASLQAAQDITDLLTPSASWTAYQARTAYQHKSQALTAYSAMSAYRARDLEIRSERLEEEKKAAATKAGSSTLFWLLLGGTAVGAGAYFYSRRR